MRAHLHLQHFQVGLQMKIDMAAVGTGEAGVSAGARAGVGAWMEERDRCWRR